MTLIGFEQEFYLNYTVNDNHLIEVNQRLQGSTLKPERGTFQYELVTPPLPYTVSIAHLRKAKEQLQQELTALGYSINYTPKPFAKDYGSSLQISFSVPSFKEIDYLNAIYCILHHSAEFHLQLNRGSGFARFVPGFMAPTHICWGGNDNRTTLIRALNLSHDSDDKAQRVEFRLANSDVDEEMLQNFIIEMIALSQQQAFSPHYKTWGNADQAPRARPLPKS